MMQATPKYLRSLHPIKSSTLSLQLHPDFSYSAFVLAVPSSPSPLLPRSSESFRWRARIPFVLFYSFVPRGLLPLVGPKTDLCIGGEAVGDVCSLAGVVALGGEVSHGHDRHRHVDSQDVEDGHPGGGQECQREAGWHSRCGSGGRGGRGSHERFYNNEIKSLESF